MRKNLLIFFLLISTCSYAQEKVYPFRLKIHDKGLTVSKLQADSTISVLKKRLLNSGYKNPTIAYSARKKEFIIELDSAIDEEFIDNWLIKPCRTFFYETYNVIELFDALAAGSNHNKTTDKRRTLYSILNLNDSIINNRRISNLGLIKLSDTTEFYKIIKDLKSSMPQDCLFAYQQNRKLLSESALAVFAIKNNRWKLPLTGNLDSVKTVKDWDRKPALSIRFNKIGSKKFEAITLKNVGKPLAIVIDGMVYSAPFVNGPIEGGRAEISGDFTAIEAKQLTSMISGGYLPIKLTLIK